MRCQSTGCVNVKARASLLCCQFIPCQALLSAAQTQAVDKSQQTQLRSVVKALRAIQVVQMLIQVTRHLNRSTAVLMNLLQQLTWKFCRLQSLASPQFPFLLPFCSSEVGDLSLCGSAGLWQEQEAGLPILLALELFPAFLQAVGTLTANIFL